MKVNKPWGYYQVILNNEKYKVKLLSVNPLQSLSLQYYKHRSEHWVVVNGIATVTVDNIIKEYFYNDFIYIDNLQLHRLENKTMNELQVIEIQCGEKLDEEDIIRYIDNYNRC